MKINNALLSALTLGILLCGCNFKPVTPQKQTGFKADYASTNVRTQWWKSFNDPQLNALIQSALEQNSDLQTALNNVTRKFRAEQAGISAERKFKRQRSASK